MSVGTNTARPPIAVVGVSAIFPGSINATGFWSDILSGKDLLTEVPPSHWLVEDHFDSDMLVKDKTYGRRGGFLSEVGLDAMGFGIPPNLLGSTDTAQLLALIVAQSVLDDATRGQFSPLDRSRCSVILGVTSGQELLGNMASRMNRPMWLQGMRRAGVPEGEAQSACDRIADLHPEWTESTFPGLLGNVVAGRIANRLDLGGTNCVTDAACASSFAALSMAVNELYLGDSDMVIAGGVDTMNDIFMYMCFSKTPALSLSEDIRPFSDQADGTMLGEGIGMVALKRLEDAEADGNDIYCVINAVGSSSDGRSKSVYAPVSAGQARALSNTYEKTGYGPETVELLEAHGTGTVAGDAAEFRGLEIAFDASGRQDRQWCALGTVKSQIGHTKAAAGAAGLFKVVMALHHKVLPQTAKIDQPNPKLNVETSPFHLNTKTRPWIRGSDHERRGSVSSFGFGGSNFHVALSEYTGFGSPAPRLLTRDAELVVLTGANGAEVIEQAKTHASAATETGYLRWLAQTTQLGYQSDARARLAIVARDELDLVQQLGKAIERIERDPSTPFTTPRGIHYGTGTATGDVAFVFPGQGSQYLFMGAELAGEFGEAMALWDVAADLDWHAERLHDVVFPITSFDQQGQADQLSRLTATEWAQPAIGATSLSMLRILRSIGVQPSSVGGHSFGEITALHAAGVLSETDMLRVARRRGELMAEAARTPGSMTAVTRPIEEVRQLVADSGVDVVVANHNSPTQVVLSGATSAIEEIEAKLAEQKIAAKRLPVATAFHSQVVSEASTAFAEFLETVEFNRAKMPVLANETAKPYPADIAKMQAQLGRQLANPVRFVEMIEAMYADGIRTFVEVGPSSILTSLVGEILKGRQHVAIEMDRKNKEGLATFFGGLGRLVAAGVPMNFAPLWSEYAQFENPHEVEQPKLVIPINGANSGNPYPPQDLSELVGPNPERQVTSPMPQESHQTSAPTPSVDRSPVAAAPVAVAPVVPAPSQTSDAPSGLTLGALAAYQAIQQQTAEAHASYLNAMAQTHASFLDTAKEGLAALGRLGGVGLPVAQSADAAVQPVSTLPGASRPTAHQSADAAAQPVSAPIVVAAPITAPPVQVREGDDGLMTLLLEVVSDKTGYPSDMLNMEMELEADLGIDSIKRVEILSAMQDAVPELPEVDTSVMAELVTLGQIVDYMNGQIESSASPSVVQVREGEAPAEPVRQEPHPPVSGDGLMTLLLEVVSDKTGYPSDMLNMEMELEADLGIDSIKRVEILSAMQDAVPQLPEVDTSVMAELVTLGQIVDYMNGQLEVSSPSVAAPALASTSSDVPTVSGDGLMTLLLDVVSDKTGYPSDMLNMEMELEADLGIDSIKRVEILSAMQDAVPQLPEVDTSVMAELVTLGQIVDYMNGQLEGDSAAISSPAMSAVESQAAASSTSGLLRYTLESVPAAPTGTRLPGLSDGPLAVTDDGKGVARALVGILQRAGIDAVTVATVPESGVSGAIFLGGLRDMNNVTEAIATNQEAFVAARTIAKSGLSGGVFVTVSDNGGAFGCADTDDEHLPDDARPWSTGLTGLARTAAIEWPTTTVKALDVQRQGLDTDAIAQAIADELLAGGTGLEVGLKADGSRYVLRSKLVDVEPGRMPIGPTDVIVVSGGGRGVTAATMIQLAKDSGASFALLGRSELVAEPTAAQGATDDASLKRALLDAAIAAGQKLSPADLGRQVNQILANREILATIASIEQAGGRATYLSVDITDDDAVTKAMATIRSSVGPITGIVHGAGVLADKLLADKTDEQFNRVFSTKVQGLRSLLTATAGDSLKLLCFFSSVAARTGNTGQADYAMANEILNKVALAEGKRRGPKVVVKSLGWGPWAGGMVSPALKSHFESMGVTLIPLDEGARMLVKEIASPQRNQIELVLGGGVLPESRNGAVVSRDSAVAQQPTVAKEPAVAEGAGA